MRVIQNVAEMQALALDRRRKGGRAALVPTMGALHEGHLSLVRLAHAHGDEVDVSIFVNPTQFGPNEDLSRYPRTLERDLEQCREANVNTVFCPPASDVYTVDHSTGITETALSAGLCGSFRPGHFDGVVTVVAKLFNIMLPAVAVFGQKDFQQVRVIQRMVRDLNFAVEIVVGPIIREDDGLAMSSRNRYLSPAARQQALTIFRVLTAAREAVAQGERDADAISSMAVRTMEAAGLDVQYVACVDIQTLQPVTTLDAPAVMAVAAYVGQTRLIDNAMLKPGSGS